MADLPSSNEPQAAACQHKCSFNCSEPSNRRRSPQGEDDQQVKKPKNDLPETDESSTNAVNSSPPRIPTSPPVPPQGRPAAFTPPVVVDFSPLSPRPAMNLARTLSDPFSKLQMIKGMDHCMKEFGQIYYEFSQTQLDMIYQEDLGGATPVAVNTGGASPISVVDNNQKEPESDGGYESLTVDMLGKRRSIQFKCPCGKGYQFLLTEGSCYYRIT